MTPSNIDPIKDYEDLIAGFNTHGVEYIIIGAYAVGHHGFVRGTADLDILVSAAPENARRLAAALKDFAGLTMDPSAVKENTLITLGQEPNSVDILTTAKGMSWESAWSERQPGRLGTQTAHFLSYRCLIESKRAVGRHKDLADIEGLGGSLNQ